MSVRSQLMRVRSHEKCVSGAAATEGLRCLASARMSRVVNLQQHRSLLGDHGGQRFGFFGVHAQTAVRRRAADRLGIVRAVDVIVGLAEIDLHALHGIARITGCTRLEIARPLRARRYPIRIPDNAARTEPAGWCGMRVSPYSDAERLDDVVLVHNDVQHAVGQVDAQLDRIIRTGQTRARDECSSRNDDENK
jgi:hypothetical protein